MPKFNKMPTRERLLELYKINTKTGEIFFKKRPEVKHGVAGWNGTNAGRKITSFNKDGHIYLKVDGKGFGAHRIIFYLHKRTDPGASLVDHINGNTRDNRIKNLRLCEHFQNNKNAKMHSRNTSGYKGVTFDKSRNKWCAKGCHHNVHKNLGRYDSIEEAIAAAEKYRIEVAKEFANHGHGCLILKGKK